jgi:hypothetical protein
MKIIAPGAPTLFLTDISVPGPTIFYRQIINFTPAIPGTGGTGSIGIGLRIFLQLLALTATLQAHHASHLCR